MLFLKTEPADLLDCETAKVTMLSVQAFQRVAAVVLGLGVQPSLPGEQAQPLESIGHVQALQAASLTLHDNPRKAATTVSSVSDGGARAPHGRLPLNVMKSS